MSAINKRTWFDQYVRRLQRSAPKGGALGEAYRAGAVGTERPPRVHSGTSAHAAYVAGQRTRKGIWRV